MQPPRRQQRQRQDQQAGDGVRAEHLARIHQRMQQPDAEQRGKPQQHHRPRVALACPGTADHEQHPDPEEELEDRHEPGLHREVEHRSRRPEAVGSEVGQVGEVDQDDSGDRQAPQGVQGPQPAHGFWLLTSHHGPHPARRAAEPPVRASGSPNVRATYSAASWARRGSALPAGVPDLAPEFDQVRLIVAPTGRWSDPGALRRSFGSSPIDAGSGPVVTSPSGRRG